MGVLGRALAAATLGFAVLAAGCKDKPQAGAGGGDLGTPEDAAALLRRFPASTGGGPAGPTTKVVKSAAEWESLWKQSTSHRTPASNAPPVDFAKEMVAFVGTGAKPVAGWSVEIVGARVEEGRLEILYSEKAPAAKSGPGRSSPWHAAVLAKSDLPVEWKKYEPPTAPPPKRK